MRLQRATKTADAGNNYLKVELEAGSILKVVNLYNETTPFLKATADIRKVGAPDVAVRTIALFHSAIQPANKSIHWEGDIELSEDFIVISGSFLGCTASDKIHMVVGYD